MATLGTSSPPLLSATTPTSVQPGGGLCTGLELAWGRLRRRWLRSFRPGYVRHMTDRRQGTCPDCPHDILDARDLKFCRNVCGYWFRPEDDRFRWRDRLGLARAGLAEVVCFSVLCLGVGVVLASLGFWHWAFWLLLPVLAVVWFQLVYFFRDPERAIPTGAADLVSPADGTVTHIGEVEEPDFPDGRAFRISIFLSIFSVHVNRVPRGGRVVGVRYFRGCFLDARSSECTQRNEQLWLDLEDAGSARLLRVKQISGAIARRIVCWLKVGDRVAAGERFGMIKFGSRTDVLLPAGEPIDVQVKVGDKVHGGSTVLLRFKEQV
ncbi:MAG TPA: phosphatidylserine decarboxylase [Gemmataceae bacterium]|jgi:phosphatidylserine decarboxylase|nr:phosphatidylserine decarboxylase [Gemmataceae bacterium]